jgi:adenine phosphoribosyltransferase
MVDLHTLVVDVADFPRPGITFKDVTPLLASAVGLATAVDAMVASAPADVDVVVGLEARGFLFGPPVALALGVGFVPVRKPGKLPRKTVSVSYALEYGEETLVLHADALAPGAKVLVVDDVLATGGTAVAAAGLVRLLGAEVVGVSVLLELPFLAGRARLAEHGLDQVAAVLTGGAS